LYEVPFTRVTGDAKEVVLITSGEAVVPESLSLQFVPPFVEY
jgi:hypothetical protein